jgi:hypothetical protein
MHERDRAAALDAVAARRAKQSARACRNGRRALPVPDSSGHGAERRRVADHVDARGLLLDAFTGHAGAVTAFLCDSEATRSTHEIAGFVPEHHRFPMRSSLLLLRLRRLLAIRVSG